MFMQSREAVRVKVKKYEGKLPPEQQKFSVDPQITSLEVLQSILVKAFNLKGNFSLSYKSTNDVGQDDYLGLFSDWDLDAAFLRAQNACSVQNIEPCVHLIVDVKQPNEHSVEIENGGLNSPFGRHQSKEKDIVESSSNTSQHQDGAEPKQQSGLHGKFLNQMEKTLSMVTRALNLSEDQNLPPRPPLSDAEFRSFLDPVGQVVQSTKLREVIYCGGIDPSLRRVVWKHILNVYPDGMSGKERMDYMKNKSAEYFSLRDVWRDCLHRGQVSNDLSYVTNMVKKDVLRTDRHHRFYAGSDDNQNIASLFNILTTYALNHPIVSYCQGMSDLASPLLVTMGDEAQAYICLCALMSRLYPNFLLDGEAMTLKFTHLTESLQVYDPQFYTYLKSHQADDLLFCYRWLLLEMKREFAFEDSLRMLEVLWSSLPYSPPTDELSLKEKRFSANFISEELDEPPISPLVKTPRENAYTKLCAIRRQSSSVSLISNTKAKIITYKRMNQSLDENIGKRGTNSNPLMVSKEFQSLDDAALNPNISNNSAFPVDDKTIEVNTSENFSNLKINFVYGVDKENLKRSPNAVSPGEYSINEISKAVRSPIFSHQKYKSRDGIQRFSSANKFRMSFEKLDIPSEDNENTTKKVIKSLSEFKKFSSSFKSQDIKATVPETVNATRNDSETLNYSNSAVSPSGNVIQELLVPETAHKKGCPNVSEDFNDNDSSPDDSKDYSPMTTSMTTELQLELEHLDRQVLGTLNTDQALAETTFDGNGESEEMGTNHDFEVSKTPDETEATFNKFCNSNGLLSGRGLVKTAGIKLMQPGENTDNVFIWENPLHGNGPALLVDKNKCNKTNADKNLTEEISSLKTIVSAVSGEPGKDVSRKSILRSEFQSSSEDRDGERSYTVCDLEANPKFKNITRDMIKPNSKFFSNMSQELENARKSCEVLLANKRSANLQSIATTITNFQKKCEFQNQTSFNMNEHMSNLTNHCEEVSESNYAKNLPGLLPPPRQFGGGNPFLMFLCLTVLMQHRDFIMRNQMDYNELAMHFDKMVRKHDVNRVLNQARRMYSDYLKHQNDIHNVKM